MIRLENFFLIDVVVTFLFAFNRTYNIPKLMHKLLAMNGNLRN